MREDLIKKIQSRLNASTENTIVLSALRGMGGVGKTTLVNHIVHHTAFSFKAWFNAESIINLQSQYVNLGLHCQLYTVEDKFPTKVMVEKVLRYLEACPGWVIVYDNVEKYEDIKPLLPQKGGHVIITSRHQNWPVDVIIDIDVMEVEEAVALLRNITGTKEGEKIIKKLVKKRLGLLPLAISQAGAYIKATENMTVVKYLNRYRKYEKALLASKEMPPGDAHDSVTLTFKMAFKKMMENTPEAEVLLNVCAFLDATDISEKLLLKYLEQRGINELQYDEAKKALLKYCLIKVNEKSISIHRLVQIVLRHRVDEKLDDSRKLKENLLDFFVNSGLKDYTEIMSFDKEAAEHKEYLKQLFRHALSFLEYYSTSDSFEEREKFSSLLSYLGKCFEWRGDYNQAREKHEAALAIRIELYGEAHSAVATSLNDLGLVLKSLGRYKKAKKNLKGALNIYKKIYDENHAAVATALNNLGFVLYCLGRHEEAIKKYRLALKIVKKIYGKDHSYVASTLNNLGLVLKSLKRYEEARKKFKAALKIEKSIHGEDEHPDVAISLNNLGLVLESLKHYKKAIINYKAAFKIYKKIYGKNNPDTATVLNNLGSVLESLGRYDESRRKHETALAIRIKTYGKNHPDVAASFNNLGVTLRSLECYEEARDKFEEAVAIRRKICGENHPDVLVSFNNLGLVLRILERYEEAIEKYEAALKIAKNIHGESHPDTATLLNNLGRAFQSLERYKEASEKFEEAIEIRMEIYGENHLSVADALDNLGSVLYSLGCYEEAREKYETVLSIYRSIHGENNLSVMIALNNLGNVLKSLRRFKEASGKLEEAIEISRNIYDVHPDTAVLLNNLGCVLGALGCYKEASQKVEAALKIYRKLYDENHPDVVNSSNHLRRVFKSFERCEEEKVCAKREKMALSTQCVLQEKAEVVCSRQAVSENSVCSSSNTDVAVPQTQLSNHPNRIKFSQEVSSELPTSKNNSDILSSDTMMRKS